MNVARWGMLALLASGTCLADNFELYGYGPRAAAMGGALTAEANDYTSVFYNPALLVNSKDVDFGFSFQFYRHSADVLRKDLATELDCSQCQPPDAVGTSLGLLVPLAGKVKNRLALGVGLYLPTGVMLQLNSPSPSSPYWYRYNSNPERIVIHTGIGIKIFDWLNLGVGIQALADLVGTGAKVQVDLFSKQVKTNEINSRLSTRVAPVVGLSITPWKRLRLGATYRGEMKLIYEIPASVDLQGVGVLAFAVTGIAHYSPHSVQFGAAFDILDNLTLSVDGEWMNWSAAPSPYVNLVIDLSGPTLAALGLDKALDLASAQQPPGFSDTLNGRIGLEYRVSERFSARLGGFYRPTMVPKQNTQGTNLLDGTAIGIAAGLGVNFPDPLEIFASPIQVDLAGQATFILPREAVKEPTDSVPSYTYAARVAGLTVAVRYDF